MRKLSAKSDIIRGRSYEGVSFEFVRKLPTPEDIAKEYPIPQALAQLRGRSYEGVRIVDGMAEQKMGTSEAFSEIYKRYYQEIYRYVYHRVQNIPQALAQLKKERDAQIRDVFTGKDSRFLVIIGPCSADNEEAVCDYVNRLAQVNEKRDLGLMKTSRKISDNLKMLLG